MIREIIKPTTQNYNIHIPKEYINTEVEILILPFASENNIKTKQVKKEFNPEEFYNVSNVSKDEIDDYLNSTKKEWVLYEK